MPVLSNVEGGDLVTATVLAAHRNVYGGVELKAPGPAAEGGEPSVASYDLPQAIAKQLKAQGLIAFEDAAAPAASPAGAKGKTQDPPGE
jgi:hypothetical protein